MPWSGRGDILVLEFPGLSTALGTYGASDTPAGADISVYIAASAVGSSATAEITVDNAGSPISGHDTSIWGLTATTSVRTEAIGDHFTALGDLAKVSVRIEVASGSARIRRVIARVKLRTSDALAAWDELPVYRSQRGVIESAGLYQDGGYIDPPGDTARTTPARNPADIVEMVLRSKTFGLGLRASTWAEPGGTLAASVGNGTTWTVSEPGLAFAAGDIVVCDAEAVRIVSIADTALTVERGGCGIAGDVPSRRRFLIYSARGRGGGLRVVPRGGGIAPAHDRG